MHAHVHAHVHVHVHVHAHAHAHVHVHDDVHPLMRTARSSSSSTSSHRQLHGVYLATSDGQENLSLTAWKSLAPTPKMGRRDEQLGMEIEVDTDSGSPFPAQCTFDIVEEFAPTPEAEFRHILEYTERQRFKFKLSRWQCRDLLETMCAYDAKLRTRRLFDELSLG